MEKLGQIGNRPDMAAAAVVGRAVASLLLNAQDYSKLSQRALSTFSVLLEGYIDGINLRSCLTRSSS